MDEDIQKLTPRERIEKLKKLEEEKRKEIEEARILISATEEELVAEEEQKKQIPIDQLTADTEEVLSTHEEKELFEVKRFVKTKNKKEEAEKKEEGEESTLEEEVAEARAQNIPQQTEYQVVREERPVEYKIEELSRQPLTELYAEIKNMYEERRVVGQLNEDQRGRLYELSRALDEKEEAIQEGNYTASQSIKEQLDLTSKIIKYLK
ncbi:hypothetical protein J4457_02325 [Candidatus Woesearchaeota archaeon]|nr:hypothetical protein [Candidatus Woesearchaeota archaeon]